jgi:hypothetical protein
MKKNIFFSLFRFLGAKAQSSKGSEVLKVLWACGSEPKNETRQV